MQSHRTNSGYVAPGGERILFFLSIIYIFLNIREPTCQRRQYGLLSRARALLHMHICI